MENKVDFKCEGENLEQIPDEIVEKTGVTFPKAHTDRHTMTKLSKALKEYKEDAICRVPFCVTVEAEALGADINLGDGRIGPRVNSYTYTTVDELENLSSIDFDKGRISEVLRSIEQLSNDGELATLSVEGPFTIISSLIDPMIFYKAVRKDREKVDTVMKKLEDNIVAYILKGLQNGAKIISYGDPVGGMDIIGPKVYKEINGQITYNILKRVEDHLDGAIVHLCGKTSTALNGIGLCEAEQVAFMEGTTYGEAIVKLLEDQASETKFIGHMCIKKTPFKLKKSVAWRIKLAKL